MDAVTTLNLKPFTNTLASGSKDKTVAVWDIRLGKCVKHIVGHADEIRCVQYNRQVSLHFGRLSSK